MKINVVGTSGSGKSTLAHRLAQQLNLPYIQMDQLYWRANWQGTPDEDFLPGSARRWRRTPGAGY